MGFYKQMQLEILNPTTLDGFSYSRKDTMMPFLNGIITASMRGLKDEIDIEYLGYTFLSPKEIVEYQSKANKPIYDINITESRYVELNFMFKGEPSKNIIFQIPYIKRYGITKYKGSEYFISPVLTDLVISPSANEVFIRPQSDNIIVKTKNFLILHNKMREPITIIHSDSLLRNKSPDMIGGKPVVPLIVYDCIYHGFLPTMARHGAVNTRIVPVNAITKEIYDTCDVFESTGKKPKMCKSPMWIPHDHAVVVDRVMGEGGVLVSSGNEYTHQMIASLLYVMDILGHTGALDLIEAIHGDDFEVSKFVWITTAADLYYKLSHTPDFRLSNMLKYLTYLDGYLDAKTDSDLKSMGVYVESFAELLCYVTANFHTLTSNAKKYTNSIQTRYLDSNYYLLYAYIVGINYSFREINNSYMKTRSLTDIFKRNLLNVRFKTNVLNIHMVETSGDNLFFKTGTIQELQERGNGVLKAGGDRTFPYNSRELGGLDPVIGSLLYLPKNYPTAKAKINPASYYDCNGRFTPSEEEREMIKILDSLFTDSQHDKYVLKQAEETNRDNDTIEL